MTCSVQGDSQRNRLFPFSSRLHPLQWVQGTGRHMKRKPYKQEPHAAVAGSRSAEAHPHSAIEAFEKAVVEEVSKKTNEMAVALVQSTLDGHIQSLKFVSELLQRHRDAALALAVQAEPSFAERWAADPEWKDDGSDPGAQERWDIFLPRSN
jgi:hypothetical protein